ncbi:MAG: hypothetical protein N3A72_06430 [bacterium]|nr:hypothetical protein [bacterium]
MKKLLVSSILICFFSISVVSFSFSADKSASSKDTTAKEPSPLEIIASATEKSTVTFQKKHIYDSKGKDDPMLMPWKFIEESGTPSSSGVKGGVKGTDLEPATLPEEIERQVTGIVWCPKEPLALIGDKIVREGDEVAHAKILKINKGEVIFLYAGKKFPVKVKVNS